MIFPARRSEKGSLLVAMVAVIMLFGATYLAANALSSEGAAPDDARIQTKAEMERLADAITAFTQMYSRLPCPANPSTPENAASFGKEAPDPMIDTGCTTNVGLVPWRTLGLADSFGVDSWQNYYTYAVSPVFAQVEGVFNPQDQIFEECRTNNWVVPTGLPADPFRNTNDLKARFCCPGGATPIAIGPATDLIINNAAGQIDPNDDTAAPGRDTGVQVGNTDAPDTVPLPANTASTEAFAYVIVSHGDNGRDFGAYRVDGTNARYTMPIGVAPGTEQENADNDNTYSDRLLNFTDVNYGISVGALYFDDIVLYRTNYNTYSELGQSSCRLPY